MDKKQSKDITLLNRISLKYKDEKEWLALRGEDVTSTESSALFNCNPYMTEFELWHKKKSGNLEGLEQNEAMEIGHDFEAPIAYSIAKKEGWNVNPKKDYMRLDGLRIGSSFDFEIIEPFKAIFEIKNVGERSWNEYWKEDGENIDAPINLEFQFQHELLVSGADRLVVGAMVGGNRRKQFTRLPDPKIHDAIIEKVAAFWKSIEEGIEPKPDFNRDAEFIAKLFGKAEKGTEVFADEEIVKLAESYKMALEIEKEVEARKKSIKSQILLKVGSVEKVSGEDFSISLSETKGSSYTVERKPGRSFRIFWEKGEQDIE